MVAVVAGVRATYTFNGLSLIADALSTADATDAYGVEWYLIPGSSMVGPKAAPREVAVDNANRDGTSNGTQYYGNRNPSFSGECVAPSMAALNDAEARLKAAVTLSTFPLVVSQAGFSGVMYVRQSGEVLWTPTVSTPDVSLATFSVGLVADDPRIYDLTDTVFSLSYPASSGGLTWPATWPATWAATTTSGTTTVTNPSAISLPIRFRLTGPMTNASLSNPDTGQTLNFVNPNGPLLAAGEFLDVDTATHSVLLMGTANRRSWAYGSWLRLAPGVTNLALSGVGDPSATLTGRFTPARL